MSKHTHGDWEASGQLIVTAALHGHPNPKAQRSPKIIGEVHWDYDGDHNAKESRTEWREAEANQRLMIAAPDLLKALQNLTEWGRTHTSPLDANSPHDLLIAAVNAIAKATGETV